MSREALTKRGSIQSGNFFKALLDRICGGLVAAPGSFMPGVDPLSFSPQSGHHI